MPLAASRTTPRGPYRLPPPQPPLVLRLLPGFESGLVVMSLMLVVFGSTCLSFPGNRYLECRTLDADNASCSVVREALVLGGGEEQAFRFYRPRAARLLLEPAHSDGHASKALEVFAGGEWTRVVGLDGRSQRDADALVEAVDALLKSPEAGVVRRTLDEVTPWFLLLALLPFALLLLIVREALLPLRLAITGSPATLRVTRSRWPWGPAQHAFALRDVRGAELEHVLSGKRGRDFVRLVLADGARLRLAEGSPTSVNSAVARLDRWIRTAKRDQRGECGPGSEPAGMAPTGS